MKILSQLRQSIYLVTNIGRIQRRTFYRLIHPRRSVDHELIKKRSFDFTTSFRREIHIESLSTTNDLIPKKEIWPPLEIGKIQRFDLLLRSLRDNSIRFDDGHFLFRAAYYANRIDPERRREFINLSDRWWKRIKKVITTHDFKVTSMIFHLSHLNDDSRGQILVNIGGERGLNILLNRWLKIGLDRFVFEDILSGLTGLRKFLTSGIGGQLVIDLKKLKRWNEFMDAFERYCLDKRANATDEELAWIVDNQAGTGCLGLFRQLTVTPSTELLRCLNDWSLMELKTYVDRSKDEWTLRMVSGIDLTQYADAWIFYKINPDTLSSNSISIWFRTFSICLTVNRIKGQSLYLNRLTYPLKMVILYGDLNRFIEIYDDWHGAVLTSLENYHRNPRYSSSDSTKFQKHLAEIIFSIGQICTMYDDTPSDIVKKLDLLAVKCVVYYEKACY